MLRAIHSMIPIADSFTGENDAYGSQSVKLGSSLREINPRALRCSREFRWCSCRGPEQCSSFYALSGTRESDMDHSGAAPDTTLSGQRNQSRPTHWAGPTQEPVLSTRR
jgi:hypothetical protein